MKRPNILVMYTDQQRYDSLSCYGNKAISTPNIDGLAKDGVRFTHHFVQNPVCMPSRISMLSSRYPSNLGIGTNGIPAPETIDYLWQVLKPYDYHTGNIGKLHFTPHVNRFHQDTTASYGLDTLILSDEPGCYDDAYSKWVESVDRDKIQDVRTSLPPAAKAYGHPEYSNQPRETHEPYVFHTNSDFSHSDFVAEEVCDYINRHKDDRFCCIAGFYAPHTPLNPQEKYVSRVDDSKIVMPIVGPEDNTLDILKGVDEDQWLQVIKHYLALVVQVDDCVGRIVSQLKALDIYDETIIVFTSDHGEYLGDHGRIQKGWPGHEMVIRVPLIVTYKAGIDSGLEKSGLVESVDIVPTLLDYAGIQVPTTMQGTSLKSYIAGESKKHKSSIVCEMFDPVGYRGALIRTDRYKYYIDLEEHEFLYDLQEDPDELCNLFDSNVHQKTIANLRRQLILRQMEVSYRSRNQEAAY